MRWLEVAPFTGRAEHVRFRPTAQPLGRDRVAVDPYVDQAIEAAPGKDRGRGRARRHDGGMQPGFPECFEVVPCACVGLHALGCETPQEREVLSLRESLYGLGSRRIAG